MPPPPFPTTALAKALASVTERVGSSIPTSPCPESETRTLWTIVISCAATIFACVYKSLHLSIPSPFDGPLLRLLRSIGVMSFCVLFPEGIAYAALREYLVAREWTLKFKKAIKTRRESEKRSLATRLRRCRSADSAFIRFSTSKGVFDVDDCQGRLSSAQKLGSGIPPVDVHVRHIRRLATDLQVRCFELDDGESARSRVEENVVDADYPMFRWVKHWRSLVVRKDDLKPPEWTVTHSMFADMGGFMLYYDGNPCFSLDAKELLDFIQLGLVDVPDLSEADIDDCSKGDVISKAFVVVQVLWFGIQFLARFPEHFDVTPLEIGTFAYCFPCFLMYAFSWHKPLGVSRPRRVYWVGSSSMSTPPIPHSISGGIVLSAGRDLLRPWDDSVLASLFHMVLLPCVVLLSTFMSNRVGVVRYRFRTRSLGRGDRELYDHERYRRYDYKIDFTLLVLLLMIALTFGALHLLGWDTFFPTVPEKIVWRTAALATTGSPFIFTLSTFIDKLANKTDRTTGGAVLGIVAALLLVLSVIAYVLGRVALLVLMLTTLRDLPPTAYCAIPWIQIFPHF